ncbi:MAG: beta-hydroxyacyl-ACP dehydratase [Myxococcales bacterium]|nr:beta-hydroxyacyl-ACP dehydratase [Myxococcales bacterium]
MRWSFLDRIDELIPGERARGRKGVASSEDYFADHFPGFPVVPGVVQVEALAQLSGKLIEVTVRGAEGRWVWPILSMVRKAKFRRFVRPGDPLTLHSELTHLRGESALCKVHGMVDGQRTCDAELVFVFNPDDLDTTAAQERLERLERENLKLLWPGYEAWDASLKSD